MKNDYENMDEYMTYLECDREEREEREREMQEKRKFVEGMKRYPEMGIPVFIDDRIPREDVDWDKLTRGPRDGRYFYMADYVEDKETGKLKEIRWNPVSHGDIESEAEMRRKRAKKMKR